MPKAPSLFYRLLSLFLLPVWAVHAALHSIKFNQLSYFINRIGLATKTDSKAKIWVHMASVGEVNLMQPLCDALLKQGHSLLLTTFSATGLQQAKLKFTSNQVSICILPIDFLPFSIHFSNSHNIKLALIAETELWPETLYQVAKNEVPILHINARLSPKSLKAFAPIQATLKSTLQYFNHHYVRFESDKPNFQQMGASDHKISVMDNLKYAAISTAENKPTSIIGRDYLLMASTHPNEELMFAKLKQNNPQWPLMVIAPRHPKRAQEILKQLAKLSLNVAQRSKGETINTHTDIYLADTLGEMEALFKHAQCVVMGGSFVDIGGHNIIEPASLGCCIVTGFSDDNIKQDVKALEAQNGLKQIFTIYELEEALDRLIKSPKERVGMANNAQQFVRSKQTILPNYLKEIEGYLYFSRR